MINNSIFRADAQVCYNLDVRLMHEHDRKRKMLKHDNIIEQSGRSMIEMLGVLAIVGVLSVGGIAGYSKAMEKFKINKTIDQISHLVTNIRTLYAQQTTYDGLDNDTAILMGVVPDDMPSGVGTHPQNKTPLSHPFGNNIFITSDDATSNKAILIVTYNIPKTACLEIATKDWGDASGLIAIGGSAISGMVDRGCEGDEHNQYACPGGSKVSTPMPIHIATKLCDDDNGNDIWWKFY